jgi:hypothetical protein
MKYKKQSVGASQASSSIHALLASLSAQLQRVNPKPQI